MELVAHSFGATRAMNVANAASCCLMKPRVVSSLISPVVSSSLDAQLPMKISGLLSVKASRNIIALRRSAADELPFLHARPQPSHHRFVDDELQPDLAHVNDLRQLYYNFITIPRRVARSHL